MEKYQVSDEKFKAYGRVLTGYDCSQLMKEMEHSPVPINKYIVEGIPLCKIS